MLKAFENFRLRSLGSTFGMYSRRPQPKFEIFDLAMIPSMAQDLQGEPCGIIVEIYSDAKWDGGDKGFWWYVARHHPAERCTPCHLQFLTEDMLVKPKYDFGDNIKVQYEGDEVIGKVLNQQAWGNTFVYQVRVGEKDVIVVRESEAAQCSVNE